ncbi:MAG TPA: 3-hydroxyacyl-CoA dehydrogenase NAD-binding domain-containing protein [Candidatus Acidoferrum sp.]
MPSESNPTESHRLAPGASRPSLTIALIGATKIAEQIASRALCAGINVIIDDISDARLQAASIHLHDFVRAQHCCAPGPHDQPASPQSDFSSSSSTVPNLTLTQSIESAIRQADFLIDALPDDLEVKLELFTLFDKFAKPNAIFITTGSIPIDDLAGITFSPDRCVAVEITVARSDGDTAYRLIAGAQTSPETLALSSDLFARVCGFLPVQG